MTTYFIALDTHRATTDLAAVTAGGKIVKQLRCPTTVSDLVEAVTSLKGKRNLTFEEGPIADWLMRELQPHVETLVVCDPRQNALIAKGSDKDDAIDALKLAQLFRGGFVKPVHHPETFERAVFKRHVGMYHGLVRDRVRSANYIIAQFRHQGIMLYESQFDDAAERAALLRKLPASKLLRFDFQQLWSFYDAAVECETAVRNELIRHARRIEPIRRFVDLPGIFWIRAATFYAVIDTPWRFESKSALWKYMGIGIERRQSGQGRERLRITPQCNHPLKAMILGAAITAISRGDNPFAAQYERWLSEGISAPNARRNVARSLASTLWGMWKNSTEYDPTLVGTNGRRA
jgi:transposase